MMAKYRTVPRHKTQKTPIELIEEEKLGFPVDVCEFCYSDYPVGAGEKFYYIEVFGKPHKICSDCHDQFMVVTDD